MGKLKIYVKNMLIYTKNIVVWKKLVNTETTEEFVKELDLTEEEIESYTGCSERTQRCLTDCPWPFPGAYINEAS